MERLGFDPYSPMPGALWLDGVRREGNETTPSSRFEFKFKDYAPWVFRSVREISNIDAADYLVPPPRVPEPCVTG